MLVAHNAAHGGCATSECFRDAACSLQTGIEPPPPQSPVVALVMRWRALPSKEIASYYHMWPFVESFFCCVVQGAAHSPWAPLLAARRDGGQARVTLAVAESIFLPRYRRSFPIFEEVSTMLSGPGTSLDIVRRSWPWLQAERPNCSVSEALRAEAVSQGVSLIAELDASRAAARTGLRAQRALVHSIRSTAWANLGAPPPEQRRAVVFVGRGPAPIRQCNKDTDARRAAALQCDRTTNRRLAREHEVRDAARALFAERAPELRFEYAVLPNLGYRAELELLRSTRVFISLYGASLVNCRFLPDDAVVVEIHGAAGSERGRSDFYKYRTHCADEAGLRWVGFAAAEPYCSETARVEPGEFVQFLRAVVAEQWEELDANYAAVQRNTSVVCEPEPPRKVGG